jgi:hypothetical protein
MEYQVKLAALRAAIDAGDLFPDPKDAQASRKIALSCGTLPICFQSATVLLVPGAKTKPFVTLRPWKHPVRRLPKIPPPWAAPAIMSVPAYREVAGGVLISRILQWRMLPERQSPGDDED